MLRHRWRRKVVVPMLTPIELVMKLEESFQVAIPDDEGEKLITVGDIKRYFLDRVNLIPSGRCATQRSFFRLRLALCEILPAEGPAMRPSTRWADIQFPWGRRIGWWRLRLRVGNSLPAMPTGAQFWMIALPLFTAWFGPMFVNELAQDFIQRVSPSIGFVIMVSSTILLAFFMWLFTGPPPAHRRTVGDTPRLLAALDDPVVATRKSSWTRDEVTRTVDRLFVEATGAKDFTDDSVIVEGW